MKKALLLSTILAFAVAVSSCTQVYPTRVIRTTVTPRSGGGTNASVNDPVRHPTKSNPDYIEPVRSPSTYSY